MKTRGRKKVSDDKKFNHYITIGFNAELMEMVERFMSKRKQGQSKSFVMRNIIVDYITSDMRLEIGEIDAIDAMVYNPNISLQDLETNNL